jgi:hypothetical protein
MKKYFKDYGAIDIGRLTELLMPLIKQMSADKNFTQYGFLGRKNSNGEITFGEGKTEPGMRRKLDRWNIWREGYESGELLSFIKDFDQKKVARLRLMKTSPRVCYYWHYDISPRLHIPIITNNSSFLIVEDEVCHLTQGHLWFVDTEKMHTALNGGTEDRFHLVYEYFGNVPYIC